MPREDLCCTRVSESNASSDPTYLLLLSTSSSGASSAGKSILWDAAVQRLKEFAALALFWLGLLVDQCAEVLCREH